MPMVVADQTALLAYSPLKILQYSFSRSSFFVRRWLLSWSSLLGRLGCRSSTSTIDAAVVPAVVSSGHAVALSTGHRGLLPSFRKMPNASFWGRKDSVSPRNTAQEIMKWFHSASEEHLEDLSAGPPQQGCE
mmetsp:Transcript_71770/g.164575  ORF Transcript_71770/g.164575 Transcript_71770/m.164575 type:complete len:132 (+) Transcript_71770:232-627(+)